MNLTRLYVQFHPWEKILGDGIIEESEKDIAPPQKKDEGNFKSKQACN